MVNNITIKKENKQSDPCFFKIDMTDDNYNVSYEITNKCNLECQHCFNKSSKDASFGLNKDELSLLIKELKQINVKNVYITGGEPTCYPYFEYALENFYKNNIEIILATNGYNTLQYLDAIKKYCSPRAGVHISIDGMKDVHNELRGKKDAYEHAIKTIETLLENGIKVKISTVIWNENYRQIKELCTFLKELGVSQINLNILVKSGRTDIRKIRLDEDYLKIIDTITNIKNELDDSNFKIIIKRGEILNKNSCGCYAGSKMLHINSEGLISPCSWISKANIKEYSKKWEPGKLKECIETIRGVQEVVNKRKEEYGYCGCIAMAQIYNNDKLAEDPLNTLLK